MFEFIKAYSIKKTLNIFFEAFDINSPSIDFFYNYDINNYNDGFIEYLKKINMYDIIKCDDITLSKNFRDLFLNKYYLINGFGQISIELLRSETGKCQYKNHFGKVGAIRQFNCSK